MSSEDCSRVIGSQRESIEIRVKDAPCKYRVIYVAKSDEAVYVLHAFKKHTQKTSKADISLARARYNALVEETKLR